MTTEEIRNRLVRGVMVLTLAVAGAAACDQPTEPEMPIEAQMDETDPDPERCIIVGGVRQCPS